VLIIDEVATGFGRTGKLFACEHYNLQPDIICLGKGLTGGYGALAATLMTAPLAKSMEFDFSYYSTFGWHPLAVCATLANLNYLLKNKNQILKNTNRLGSYFEKRLLTMKFKYPHDVNIKGLAIGLKFSKPGYAGELEARCLEKQLLVSRFDVDKLTLFPALNIDLPSAKKGLDILESCR
jgi:acetylornithine/succinyldiaminopimelate/putrescine aminotransferase